MNIDVDIKDNILKIPQVDRGMHSIAVGTHHFVPVITIMNQNYDDIKYRNQTKILHTCTEVRSFTANNSFAFNETMSASNLCNSDDLVCPHIDKMVVDENMCTRISNDIYLQISRKCR